MTTTFTFVLWLPLLASILTSPPRVSATPRALAMLASPLYMTRVVPDVAVAELAVVVKPFACSSSETLRATPSVELALSTWTLPV